MSSPRPLCTDFFFNRTGRNVEPDEILSVDPLRSMNATEFWDVRVSIRSITAAPPDCVFEAEVCMPHGLHWALARQGR